MEHDDSPLFTAFRLGPHRPPRRVVMAPMTRNRAGDGNVPTEMNATYHRQRSSASLIVAEATWVEPRGIGYPGIPGIADERRVEGWRRVTSTVREEGWRIFLQLWHGGRISHPDLQPDGGRPVAPSALRPEGEAMTPRGPRPFVEPLALEAGEVGELVEVFRRAAERAHRAGFGGGSSTPATVTWWTSSSGTRRTAATTSASARRRRGPRGEAWTRAGRGTPPPRRAVARRPGPRRPGLPCTGPRTRSHFRPCASTRTSTSTRSTRWPPAGTRTSRVLRGGPA